MDGSLCTTITSGGSNPPESTLTYQSTTYGSAIIGESIERLTLEFKIVEEISPKVFRLSGDFQATDVPLEMLETSLPGTVLLVEYDGNFLRLFTWLGRYGLSRDTFNAIYLGADFPDHSRLGRGYLLAGCWPEIRLHETVLERKWSGRLFFQEYAKKPLISTLLRYLTLDIRNRLLAWANTVFTLLTAFLIAMRQYYANCLHPPENPDQDIENGIQILHSTQILYSKETHFFVGSNTLLRMIWNRELLGLATVLTLTEYKCRSYTTTSVLGRATLHLGQYGANKLWVTTPDL